MLILGIETSSLSGSIAFVRDGTCLLETELDTAPRRHAQTLVSQIQQGCGRMGLRMAELDAVAVSVGPGSFTGLRVGVVCAKTLAYATGCRLAAVDTLEGIAANTPQEIAVVHVIADAQRGDICVGTYHRTVEGEWVREGPPKVLRADAWLGGLSVGDAVTGPGLAAYRAEGATVWRSLPETAWTPLARSVAAIGARQIQRGILANCETLEPFYVRRSAAEERADAAGSVNSN